MRVTKDVRAVKASLVNLEIKERVARMRSIASARPELAAVAAAVAAVLQVVESSVDLRRPRPADTRTRQRVIMTM